MTTDGHYTIKQIFQDNNNWDNFKNKHDHQLRPTVKEEVEKMLSCRDFAKLGYYVYRCPDCGRVERIVPFSCKSRFCASCGKIAVDNWIDNALSWFIDAPYYHLVFTVPEELRNIFLYDRTLLNLLFRAASKTVLEWCRDTGGYVPGIVCVLHSFGSVLNHNPHIHMMITAGGLSAGGKDKWISNEFIPWTMLKDRWKYNLVTLVKPELKRLIQTNKAVEYLKLGTGPLFHSFLE
jgi:hypothetical protein